MKKRTILGVALLLGAFSIAVFGGDFGPWSRRGRRGGRYSVAEPAAIVLLGAGLASVGAYAIKKRKKK
ncbi:MAG: PEP-CTERM sorting domain-containing protein [candidate division WOR-3 bacterium]